MRTSSLTNIVILIITGALVAACDGSSGAAGAPGPSGPPGPGGGGGAPVADAEKINVQIDRVEVESGGADATVFFSLTNDQNLGLTGMPPSDIRFLLAQLSPGQAGGSSEWQAYTTRDDGGVTNAQATTERGSAGTLTDNGDGTYSYTFENALPDYPAGPVYDATKTHRIGIEIRLEGADGEDIPANNSPTDFLPSGGAPTFTRLIVDSDTCNACHDVIEAHGGARRDIEYCVECHNPSSIDGNTGNTVDMKRLIHNIHSARPDYEIVGFSGEPEDWADLEWPQDIRNCQTCHEENDANTPQASNWRLVANRAACGTCHYDDGIADNDENDYAIEDGVHPGGFQFNDDVQCLDCHGPNGSVTNEDGRLVQIPVAHEILEQTAGRLFEFNILAVTDTAPGDTPTVRFSVTNPEDNDAPYDINADEPFVQCDGGASRLAVAIGWSTTDYANIGSGSLPGLPISLNPLSACGGASTNIGGNIFEVTSPTPIPLSVSGTLAAALEGHPAVDVDGDSSYERIAVKNAVFFAPVTDAAAVARRNVVDIQKCDDCHKELSMHGNNRTDEPQVCVICHNPMVTDVNRRGGGDCLAELGPDDQSVDFKYLIHSIHATGELGTTFDVCGFGSSANQLEVEYPGRLNNCEGCHLEGTYYPVDPDEVFGTTISANDPAILTDDVVVSPNAAVCSTCHVSEIATVHIEQNGGDFSATKAADGSLVSAGIETCELCHGEGRVADVKEVHEIDKFEFN
jgi:OmcA/MtrC family decaheme c-type cytochrome